MKRLMTRATPKLPAVVFFCVVSKLAPLSHPRHRPVTLQNHNTNELDCVQFDTAYTLECQPVCVIQINRYNLSSRHQTYIMFVATLR